MPSWSEVNIHSLSCFLADVASVVLSFKFLGGYCSQEFEGLDCNNR